MPKESKTHPTLRNIMNSSLQSQQKSQVSLLAKKPVFESASIWIGKCSCLSSDLHTLAPQGWPEGCTQGGKLAESGTQHTLPLPRGVFQRYHRARSSMAGWVHNGKIGNERSAGISAVHREALSPTQNTLERREFLSTLMSPQGDSLPREMQMVYETGWNSPPAGKSRNLLRERVQL